MKEVIIAILGSGAFFTFIQFMINRFDTRKAIEKRLDSLDEKFDRSKAIEARNHILRFSDELRNGLSHSEDYFRQIIIDCDTYDRYCTAHPDFSNGLTQIASEHIREEFRKVYKEGNKHE